MKINPHAAQVVHASQPKQPPAQAARDLAATAELADKPFGELVSRIARGEPIQSEA